MHPLVAVCVQGLGPQLVQVTISFGPVVAPVGGPPSRFFLPCDRVSVEETYILIIFRVNNDPSFDQLFLYLAPFSPHFYSHFYSLPFPFLFPFVPYQYRIVSCRIVSYQVVSLRFLYDKGDRYVDSG